MQVQDAQTEQSHVPVPLRAHTILGVCEAIGEDFGFNPIWLRVPLAASVLLSPTMAVAGYLALGLVVMAARLLFPTSKAPAPAQSAPIEAAAAANQERELAEAA